MKILAEESVLRYHVEFDEEETGLLKVIGFLPPYAEPRARLWSTKAEIEETETMLAQAREKLARIAPAAWRTAREVLAKAKKAKDGP